MSKRNSFYGTTRKDEEKKLAEVRDIAERKVQSIEGTASRLQEELKSLREVYDVEDKEGLAQWFNTDARFAEVRNDLNRAKRACRKPFFGRIDIEAPDSGKQETFYIGKTLIADKPSEPDVIDWRSPVASVYYDHSLGRCDYKVPQVGIFQTDLKRKRTYEIENDRLIDFYDSDVVANDDLLTKYLSRSKRNVLSEIIATIQQEQNEIIRKDPHHNVLVQGSAGSGKTTVAMHRISYILYNYDLEFKPESFYIVGSNQVLLNYITGVLPDLDVYGVRQMTMAELFVRLLYEDWDRHTMKVRPFDKADEGVRLKADATWFEALRQFCDRKEKELIPLEDIRIESTGNVILAASAMQKVFTEYPDWPMWRKLERLNDLLRAGLETEIYGRYYSYNPEAQKKLSRKYKDWFQRYFWKDSVFALYDDFMEKQRLLRPEIVYAKNEPDLYDLAGLAYLYKRIKETEVIQEASHVIIDEAQDFGLSVYLSLKYCMSKCTFTVMGDVSQNIYFGMGLSDWEELKKILLPDRYDYFGLLRKSYRNTVEISNFATDILRHGTFPIYPVEPIIRHGEAVCVKECGQESELLAAVYGKAKDYQEKGYETIAIICWSQKEAEDASRRLQDKNLKVRLFSEGTGEFEKGIYVLPIEYSKGLEFDAVIIFDASGKAYPKEDGYVRLLYVAATRALHELSVFSMGSLTGLIKDPVPEERKHISFREDDFHRKPRTFEEEFKTKEEIAMTQAKEGDIERALRDKYGPEKILPTGDRTGGGKIKAKSAQNAVCANASIGKMTAPAGDIQSLHRKIPDNQIPVTKATDKPPAHAGRTAMPGHHPQPSEFYTMPASTSLTPVGHGRIDTSVRWVNRTKEFVEITSNYGILRIIPLSDETVRILFSKTDFDKIKALPGETPYLEGLKWICRETRDLVEISLEKLKIRIAKKTGALEFHSPKIGTLLSESATLTRQYHGVKNVWWEYFAWSKSNKESLSTRGETDDVWKELNQTARYISHGQSSERPALIMSSKGYQLLIPGGIRTLACTIPAYGPYLCFEETNCIDYIFRALR